MVVLLVTSLVVPSLARAGGGDPSQCGGIYDFTSTPCGVFEGCDPPGYRTDCTCSDNPNGGSCNPGYYYSNNGCLPIGDEEECPCGMKADGSGCKSCGGGGFECFPINNCPPDRVMHQVSSQYGNEWSAKCRLGSAQSSVCTGHARNDDDSLGECLWMRVYNQGCCPEGEVYECEIVDRQATYQYRSTRRRSVSA